MITVDIIGNMYLGAQSTAVVPLTSSNVVNKHKLLSWSLSLI